MLHVWGGPSGSINRGPQSLLLHYIYTEKELRERKKEREWEKSTNKGFFSLALRRVSLIVLKAYWFTAIRFFCVPLYFLSFLQKVILRPQGKNSHTRISTSPSSFFHRGRAHPTYGRTENANPFSSLHRLSLALTICSFIPQRINVNGRSPVS